MASASIFRGFFGWVKRVLRPPIGRLSWRPAWAAPAALLALTFGSLPTTVPLVATTGVVLIAGATPAGAQTEATLCSYVRPLPNGDRECWGFQGFFFEWTLLAILGPNDPVFPDPPQICRSEEPPTQELDCRGLVIIPTPPPDAIDVSGCGPFNGLEIFTTDCVQADDPELWSDPDYVSPLFVPELAELTDGLAALEDEAVIRVVETHQLPSDEFIDYARGAVRAMLLARISGIAESEGRTDEEQQILDGFAEAIRLRRVKAAELAQEEYAQWAANPCSYDPPGDYTYDPIDCLTPPNPLILPFEAIEPPSSHEFKQYGGRRAYRFLTEDEPMNQLVAADTKQEFTELAAVGTAFGGALFVSLAVAAAVAASVAFIFPASLGIYASAVMAAGSTVIVTSITSLGIFAGTALIVFVGIFIAILQLINVIEWDKIPVELNQEIAAAAQPVNLEQLVRSEDPEGLQELFAAVVAATLPERDPDVPVPAATASDDRFRITDEQGANGITSPSIDFLNWNNDEWSARLSRGWFVVNGEIPTTDGSSVAFETLSLKISYVGWDGWHWTARRIGKSFQHLRAGPDSDLEAPEDSFASTEIRFVDADGANRIATVVSDGTPPEITPQVAGTLGDNGWYVSDVTLSWNVSDPESEIESQSSGCGDETITTDMNAFMRTCEATSAGGTASQSVNLKRDATPPTIAHTLSPTPNAKGWNNTSPVAIQFTCADPSPGSGIASCSEDKSATGDTDVFGSLFLGEVRDNAGNESEITFAVKIDTTPPTISGTAAPSANDAGWNNTDVTVEFACSDGLLFGSGISSCTAAQTLSTEGAGQEVSGTAVDDADHESSTTVSGIAIDKTPPVVTLATPPDGATYVQNEVVLAQWSASDALSGIGTASGSAADGAAVDTTTAGAQSFTVMASDVADNTSEVSHGYTVLSAAEAAGTLVTEVETVVTHNGTQNSLTEKLDNALSSIERGNQGAAQGQLGAFINQVEAQRGKQIDEADADALIAYAQLILGAMAPAS